MTNGNPLVSIIVRTKDRPKLLQRALRSVADQDYRPIEVVLVNDGDLLPDVVGLTSLMRDVILIHVDNQQQGRTVAANTGIRHASGTYICFLDDDDLLHDDHVSTLARCLVESDYRVAYSEACFVHTEYDPERKEIIETRREPAPTIDFSRDTLLFYNYIPFMCLMFDREVIVEAGGLDETFRLCEDWDLTIRISRRHHFHHIPKTTSDYNLWSQNLQSIRNDAQLLSFRKKIYEKHFAEMNPDVIASFIFNGYWLDRTWIENRIRGIEEELEITREQLQEAWRHGQEGWTRWDETNKRLVNVDMQLHEALKYGQEGWTKWDETHKRLIETEKQLQEAWRLGPEVWARLDDSTKRLAEAQAKVSDLEAVIASLRENVRQKTDDLRAIRNSASFSLGRALTWPARKLRDLTSPSREA